MNTDKEFKILLKEYVPREAERRAIARFGLLSGVLCSIVSIFAFYLGYVLGSGGG